MKKILLVLLSLFSFPAFAAPASFALDGQVTRIEPRISRVYVPGRECWTEKVPVQSSSDRSYGGAVIGGVTGGIVGHQVGKGSGKDVATVAGAILGTIVGDNIDNNGNRASPTVQYQDEQRCRDVSQYQDVRDGYSVTVRFQGQEILLQMLEDPGYRMIRLNFNGTVTPARW
jgi:uncharacterized protein YcfJ